MTGRVRARHDLFRRETVSNRLEYYKESRNRWFYMLEEAIVKMLQCKMTGNEDIVFNVVHY